MNASTQPERKAPDARSAPAGDPAGAGPPSAPEPSPAPGGAPPPMTPTLLARLFGVPLLIISVIVGCAVVVVLLFGSITSDRERSIASLLQVIETHSAEKTAGVLLPNEKEVWQVSRELALRLRKKDVELSAEELEVVVRRLSALLERWSAESSALSEMGRERLHFVMRALALTESPDAVGPIAALVRDASAKTRREALSSLALLGENTDVRAAFPRMIAALDDTDAVVRTMACVSLSAVARDAADPAVQSALEKRYFDENREVRWNAALALARLGNGRGKSLLLDMLDRAYWEDEVKVRIKAGDGSVSEYAMPPGAVDRYLVATVEAASHLSDPDVWTRIRGLEADAAAAVQNEVRKVTRIHDAPAMRPEAGEST